MTAAGIYREDGGEHRVEILSDETIDGMRTVRLRCLESIRPQRTPYGEVRIGVGEEFVVCKQVDFFCAGMWGLEELESLGKDRDAPR